MTYLKIKQVCFSQWVLYLLTYIFIPTRDRVNNIMDELTLLVAEGGCSTPPYRISALGPSKWPPNTPKFRDFSYFYMTYLKSKKKIFWFFTVILGV